MDETGKKTNSLVQHREKKKLDPLMWPIGPDNNHATTKLLRAGRERYGKVKGAVLHERRRGQRRREFCGLMKEKEKEKK